MQTHTLKKSKILKKMYTVFQQYSSRLDKRVAMLVHKGLLLAKKYIKQATIYFNANYVKIKRITIRVIICAAIIDCILFVYQDHIQVLEIEMSEHSKADFDYQTTVATVLSVARRAKTIFENSSDPARKRAFLNYILQNPTVNGKKLYFTIASPFNLVLELASNPNWLGR